MLLFAAVDVILNSVGYSHAIIPVPTLREGAAKVSKSVSKCHKIFGFIACPVVSMQLAFGGSVKRKDSLSACRRAWCAQNAHSAGAMRAKKWRPNEIQLVKWPQNLFPPTGADGVGTFPLRGFTQQELAPSQRGRLIPTETHQNSLRQYQLVKCLLLYW